MYKDWKANERKENESSVSLKDMKVLADHIEEYLDTFEDVFIIPDALLSSKKRIEEAILIARTVVKKLRNGDHKVFKNIDEWDFIE